MLALLLLSVPTQGAAAIPAAPSPPCYALITPCTAEYDPVCGSDGVTYSNECEAEKVCQLMICTEEYAPVCGEDGVTYDNKCKAEASNACGFKSTKPDGKGECPCPATEPQAGDACDLSSAVDTCEYNEHCQTCHGQEVCMNTTWATCVVDGLGGGRRREWAIAVASIALCPSPSPSPCEPDPDAMCPEEYDPVCGRDGVTYGNECLAEAACQLDGSTKGECCPATAPKTGDACALSSAVDTCEYDEHCENCPTGRFCWNTTFAQCTERGEWVVAVRQYIRAPCPLPPVPCGGMTSPVRGSHCGRGGQPCDDGFYCDIHPTDAWAVCCPSHPPPPPCAADKDTACTREYVPVCGSDGVTYTNKCEAEKVCQLMMCTEEYAPVCGEDGVTYDNKCKAEASNACGFKSTPGKCCKRDKKKPRKCARATNKCNKRGNFKKNCQSSCAKHCEGKETQECPRNSDRRCKGEVDCTNKKKQKYCPQSCPACVAFNCDTKELWTEEKSEWCCVHEQRGCPSPPPAPPP